MSERATAFQSLHITDCVPRVHELLDGAAEQAVLARYGGSRGIGDRPALLVIDFQQAYLGRDVPIGEQLDEFPAGSGAGGWAAYRNALQVLEAARGRGLPIYITRVAYDEREASDVSFAGKRSISASFAIGAPAVELPEGLEPRPGEGFANKSAASAFWGTDLDEFLERTGADSIVVTGLSTSGCVRATVVDAAARGIRAAVVADAVGDRLRISHEVALLDIWMKYADLTRTADLVAHLAR